MLGLPTGIFVKLCDSLRAKKLNPSIKDAANYEFNYIEKDKAADMSGKIIDDNLFIKIISYGTNRNKRLVIFTHKLLSMGGTVKPHFLPTGRK